MNSRLLYSKMFKDEFFASLSHAEKVLFIYFLFNIHVNIIHLYEVTEREVFFDTGVTPEELENAKNKFQANKKIYFYKNYVYIANASRYQRYEGERNEIAKNRLYAQLPEDVLNWYYGISDTPMIPSRYPLKSYNNIITSNSNTVGADTEIDIEEVEKGIKQLKTAKN